MVLVHGAGEHLGRYDHVARRLAGEGVAVYACDHRGHGRSGGVRMYVDAFADYVADLRKLVGLVPGKPLMVGHSMGGLIAHQYALAYPETISGLVLSSPWFAMKTPPAAPVRLLVPLLAALAPRLSLKTAIKAEDCTRDPEMRAAYASDPLASPTMTPRWFVEIQGAQRRSFAQAAELKLPFLLLQAGADRLVDPQASETIYKLTIEGDKQFKLYPELFHELFNEPERETVLNELIGWARQRELI